MTERESYRQIFSPEAERRIQNDECPNCGKSKTEWNRRTSWRCCSTECTKEFWEKHDKSWSWVQFRFEVFKRDNFTCAKCSKRKTIHSKFDDKEYGDDSKLIADHIKPLAVGGEMWNMNNLQTLCIDCNKIKTKRDAHRIAKFRKREKELKLDINMMEVKFPKQEKLSL